MKTRGLIDFRPAEKGNLRSAISQGDLEGLFREATVYGPGDGPAAAGPAVLAEGSAPPGLPGIDDWCVSIPLSLLDFRIMTLPFTDPRTMAKVIPYELDSLVLGGSQDMVFDVVVLKSLEGGSEVLVLYLRRQLLQALLDVLNRAGIDPPVVTSVELRAALGESPGDVVDFVTGQRAVKSDSRLSAVRAELTGPPVVNLRSGSFACKRDTERLWKTARVTAVLLFVLGVLIHGILGMATVLARTESSAVRDTLRKEYTALFPQERRVSDELYQLKSHVKGLQDKRALLLGASPMRVLKTLAESRVQGTYLTELSIDRTALSLRGEAPSVSDVDAFKSMLAPKFSDPRVSDVRPVTEGKTSFALTAGAAAP